MRAPVDVVVALSVALASLGSSACDDATGAVRGGQPLHVDPCDATDGGHTFTDLYTCYFGPTGKANCTAQAGCHVSLASAAAPISGFVCGATKDECWFGMTHPIYVLQGVDPPTLCDAGAAEADGSCPAPPADAGADAAPVCSCYPSASNPFLPIVPTGGAADPTTAYIWPALRAASNTCTKALCNNMPCGDLAQGCPNGTASYNFTADDLARIAAWIQEGAPND
jgi:hypothetical protein